MVVQQSKKYNQIETQCKTKVIWGKRSAIGKFEWERLPHSYAHNGEILFVDTINQNVQCDFEVENNNIRNSIIANNLKFRIGNEFYKVWVVAETFAKLTNTPILSVIKSDFIEKVGAIKEKIFSCEDIFIQYYNINKYHFAIGLKNKS